MFSFSGTDDINSFDSILLDDSSLSACVEVDIVDDDILEGAEDMTFTMSGVVSDADVRIVSPSTITVNILDNDGQLGKVKYDQPCCNLIAAGEVLVAFPSLVVTEGSNTSVCITLIPTTGSPTQLANTLTVNLQSVINAEAGLLMIKSYICNSL